MKAWREARGERAENFRGYFNVVYFACRAELRVQPCRLLQVRTLSLAKLKCISFANNWL